MRRALVAAVATAAVVASVPVAHAGPEHADSLEKALVCQIYDKAHGDYGSARYLAVMAVQVDTGYDLKDSVHFVWTAVHEMCPVYASHLKDD